MEEEGSKLTLRKNRSFHLYLLKVALTSLAFSVYSIFIPIFAYKYSGSLVFTGVVLFAQYGIYSLVFLIGPVVDRVRNKRNIFALSYSSMAASPSEGINALDALESKLSQSCDTF